jgi:hypothetical protein
LRTYCGIAETQDGYAVDVFQGDTCLEAADYATFEEAREAALGVRLRYQSVEGASRKAHAFSGRRVLHGAWGASQSADGRRRVRVSEH